MSNLLFLLMCNKPCIACCHISSMQMKDNFFFISRSNYVFYSKIYYRGKKLCLNTDCHHGI